MKLLLLLGVLTITLIYLRKQNIEPIVVSCCGNLRVKKDFKATDPDPPRKIERCLKSWDTPCTNTGSPDCCEGVDTCKPSREGGKCRKRDGSGYYIYDSNGNKLDYTEEDEKADREERSRRRRRFRRRIMNEDDDGDDEEVSETQEGIKNINYILAGVIGLTVVFLLGALVLYTDDSNSSSSSNSNSTSDNLLKKYKSRMYDNDYGNYGNYDNYRIGMFNRR